MIFLCELDGVPVSMEIETRKLRAREREREKKKKERKENLIKRFFFLFFPFDECPHWMNGEGVGWDRISFISSSSFFCCHSRGKKKRKEKRKRSGLHERLPRGKSRDRVFHEIGHKSRI